MSEDLWVETTEEFKEGQCYTATGARVIKCKICSSTEFNVAVDSYYTAIRCVTCLWEECVHDG